MRYVILSLVILLGACTTEEVSAPEPVPEKPMDKQLTAWSGNLKPAVGQTVTVDIELNQLPALSGIQFTLDYPAQLLAFTSAEMGSVPDICPIEPEADPGGSVSFACVMTGKEGKEGSGTVYSLTFTALASGEARLSFSDVKLVTPELTEMEASTNQLGLSIG
jgi:hypothetical protein